MASGTRSHTLTQEPHSNSQLNVSRSYASATRPKNDQAIIMESLPDCTNDDYLDGLEQIININDVVCISKISGSRIIVFLSKKSLADQLKDKKVLVKNNSVNIRPYIESNKRVVISNISPVVPNEIITDALKKIGIIPVSQIIYIRAGLHKPGRSHIISYRRQMYIKQEDEKILPESVQINYDNVNYWIYMSTDTTNCFVCKQSGHVAKLCPQAQEISLASQTSTFHTQTNTEENLHTYTQDGNSINISTAVKRPPPSSTTSEATQESIQLNSANIENIENKPSTVKNAMTKNKDTNDFKKPKNKKRRTNSNTIQNEQITNDKLKDLENSLSSIKQAIEDATCKYGLTYDSFKEFLEKSWGQNNVIAIATNISPDFNNLIYTMDEVYDKVKEKSLKSRFTRLKKKMLLQSDTESESDASSTTST